MSEFVRKVHTNKIWERVLPAVSVPEKYVEQMSPWFRRCVCVGKADTMLLLRERWAWIKEPWLTPLRDRLLACHPVSIIEVNDGLHYLRLDALRPNATPRQVDWARAETPFCLPDPIVPVTRRRPLRAYDGRYSLGSCVPASAT